MSTPDTPTAGLPDDPTLQQQGTTLGADPVPEPAGGVRGADAVDTMDSEPGEGTTTGADGQTAAREQLRRDLGERSPGTGDERGDDLEQSGALGDTDDPQGGSIQAGGADGGA